MELIFRSNHIEYFPPFRNRSQPPPIPQGLWSAGLAYIGYKGTKSHAFFLPLLSIKQKDCAPWEEEHQARLKYSLSHFPFTLLKEYIFFTLFSLHLFLIHPLPPSLSPFLSDRLWWRGVGWRTLFYKSDTERIYWKVGRRVVTLL